MDLSNVFRKIILDTTYQRGFDIELLRVNTRSGIRKSLEDAIKEIERRNDHELVAALRNVITALDQGLLGEEEAGKALEAKLMDLIDQLRTDEVWFGEKDGRSTQLGDIVRDLYGGRITAGEAVERTGNARGVNVLISLKGILDGIENKAATAEAKEAAKALRQIIYASEIYGIGGSASHVGVREDFQIAGRLGRMNISAHHEFITVLETDMAFIENSLAGLKITSRNPLRLIPSFIQNKRDEALCTRAKDAKDRLAQGEQKEGDEAVIRNAMKRALEKQEQVKREAQKNRIL